MSAHEMPQLWSRHLDVAIEEGVVTISYKPPPDLTLGSAVRSRDLRNCVALKLKSGEQITARFDLDETRNLVIVIAKIDLMLDRYAGEPLSHRMVEEILGITSAERARWTRTVGCRNPGWRRTVEDQNRFYLYTHPPKQIRQLANRPDIIARWRHEDAARLTAAHSGAPQPELPAPPSTRE